MNRMSNLINKFNLLMTSIEIDFFYLSLPIMKCSEILFTHIREWMRFSLSLGTYDPYCCIFVVAMVTLVSTFMINFPLSRSESEFDPKNDTKDFNLTNNGWFE